MPRQGKDTIIMVLHKKKDRKVSGNYTGISLLAHASKTLLKIIACRLSGYCKHVRTESFPTEPSYHKYDVRDSPATGVGA